MKFDTEKHIIFILSEQKTKTNVYEVRNIHQQCQIGIVRWFPSWRHYVFFPELHTVFSDRCMIKIGKFVLELNEKHKSQNKKSVMKIMMMKVTKKWVMK